MTDEDKNLIHKELCARLRHGVKTDYYDWDEDACEEKLIQATIYQINTDRYVKVLESDEGENIEIECVKMWLRPISSMTEEECDKLFDILHIEKNGSDASEWIKINDIGIIRLYTEQGKDFEDIADAIDYLNSIHVDYRGLISKGLALEVTEDFNPYKNN